MPFYRFLGTDTVIEPSDSSPIRLTRFGERVELPGDFEVSRGRPPLLPEKDFMTIGFTEEELEKYQTPDSHVGADPEFLEKKQRALRMLHEVGPAATPPSTEGCC